MNEVIPRYATNKLYRVTYDCLVVNILENSDKDVIPNR